MVRLRWVAIRISAVSLLLFGLTQVANAGAGPKVTTSLRVSRDCVVTVTGRWSDMPVAPNLVSAYVFDYPSTFYTSEPTAANRGSYKTEWQATSSPLALHTIAASVEVQAGNATYSGQLVQSPLVPCSAPLTLLGEQIR